MKKFSLFIGVLIALLISQPAHAVTKWYACASSGNMSAIQWSSTPSGSCTCTAGADLTWNSQIAGDSFYANGCTAIAVNVDPKGTGGSAGTVTLSTADGDAAGAGVAGGGFTYATAAQLTITANIAGGTTTCLTITGSQAGAAGTILGNLSAAAGYGVADSHTVGTLTIGSSETHSTVTGGTATATYAYAHTGTGPVTAYMDIAASANSAAVLDTNNSLTIIGSATASGDNSALFKNGGTNLTFNGDCIASTGIGVGCSAYSGNITVNGNIVGTATAMGASNRIIWAPATAQNYFKIGTTAGAFLYLSAGLGSDSGGTQITGANTAAKVSSGTYFVKKDDGVFTQGTASGGGGGAWSSF